MSGSLEIDGTAFGPQAWGRLPADRALKATVGTEGAALWLKDADLMPADILAIPDTVTDVTASPLKLFEYMAMARPIISVALPAFAAQGKTSYCALENARCIVLCMDSAYHAPELDLYNPGSLQHGSRGNSQTAWLSSFAERARSKRVIVLSHHPCLSFDGAEETQLYRQVTHHLGRAPDLWFCGHTHRAIVYAERNGMRARCAGHGAIPYGRARALDDAQDVVWYETRLAADSDIRVRNGFVLLTLDGDEVCEELIAEDGSVAWPNRADQATGS